jgi:hypothetical protein
MLISFRVLIFLAAQDLHNSLNSSSGHTVAEQKTILITTQTFKHVGHVKRGIFSFRPTAPGVNFSKRKDSFGKRAVSDTFNNLR